MEWIAPLLRQKKLKTHLDPPAKDFFYSETRIEETAFMGGKGLEFILRKQIHFNDNFGDEPRKSQQSKSNATKIEVT